MRTRIAAAIAAICASGIAPAPAGAWDYPGHRIVGAIADLVLQQHHPATYQRVSELLELRPAIKDVNLRDAEAIWLIAHLVGDIHQPLHVGALYFGETCRISVDPNRGPGGPPKFGIGTTVAETIGGNLIYLVSPHPMVPP